MEMNSEMSWRSSGGFLGLCQDPVILGYPKVIQVSLNPVTWNQRFAASFVSDVLHRLDAVVEGLIKPTTVAVSLGLFSQNCSYGPKNNYLGGIIMRYNQLVFSE